MQLRALPARPTRAVARVAARAARWLLTRLDMVIGILIMTALATGLGIWSIHKDRQQPRRIGTIVLPLSLPAARVERPVRPRAKWPWVLGIGWLVAAFVVVVWPEAASDCHGSPVCGLDGFAVLFKLFFAAVLAFIGALWLVAVAVAQQQRR